MISDANIFLFDVIGGKFTGKGVLPYKSVVWEMGFVESGALQIVYDRNSETEARVTVGTFARFQDLPWLPQCLMYIHTVKITRDEVWAYGYEAKELLKKCELRPQPQWGEQNLTDTITDIFVFNVPYSWFMKYDGEGDLAGLRAADMGEANIGNLDYMNVFEYIAECCKLKGFGFTVDMDLYENVGKAILYIYEADDHTDKARFSPMLGNLDEYTYVVSDKGWHNIVTAIGMDTDGETEIYEQVTNREQDEEKYSVILDLRTEMPRDEGVSMADYRSALQTRARMSLGQRKTKRIIDVQDSTVAQGALEYNVGWLVKIILPAFGLSVTKVISKVAFIYEKGQSRVKYTFGTP